MQAFLDSGFELDARCVERMKRRIAALERCAADANAFTDLDQWDAEARAHLRRQLRGQAEAYLRLCLSYDPRVYGGLVDVLRNAEARHDDVTALRTRGSQVLRGTSLRQALFMDAELSLVAADLARGGIETFADLEKTGRDRLLEIGVTLGQIEMLDRACASGGLRMKAA